MGRRNLNLEGASKYLQTLRLTQIDGIHNALLAKIIEIGIAPKPGSARTYELTGEVTGSLRGILDWIGSITAETATKGDKKSLQILHDVVCVRCKAAGYTPKADDAEALT